MNERFWGELYRQEHEILFSMEENAFFQYNYASGLSEKITDDAIKMAISKRISEVSKTWKEFAHLRPMSNQRNVISVISPLKAKSEVYKAFEISGTLIACRNCLLRLDRGEFVREEFSPKYRLRFKSPYDYDPSAQCPHFKRHLLSHTDADDQLVLQKLAGQAITGRNLCQRMAILDGVSDVWQDDNGL